MSDASTNTASSFAPSQTIQYTTPTTGSTITATAARDLKILINPAGALLALTLALNGSPQNGDIVTIGASQAVTTFSMTGGTVVGPLTSLAIGTFAQYMYSSDASEWFRIG